MKLQALQENLSKALNIASRFTSVKAQLPVLSNILLSAKKNKLLISSTNLETSISLSIGAKVEKEGELTVPARVITDLVSNLASGSVTLEAKKEQLKISAQEFSSSVIGMNPADFPSVPRGVGKNPLNLSQKDFIDALDYVLFATSIDETRPVLTGVLLIFKEGKLVLVATDGFRLSQKKMGIRGIKELQKIIIPKTVLAELGRLATDEERIKYSLRKEDNQVVFEISDTVLSSRIIEGEFPDFEKIIPKDSEIKVNLDREELLRAVKLASVFARDSANVVKVAVKKDSVVLSAESSQAGTQKTQVDAKIESSLTKTLNTKEGFGIAFNYRFLEDFLNAVKGEEVQIELSSSNAPGIFTDPKDRDFLHLIMPVRIQS
jgi:DNA polymerase-3 subunit beta